MFTKWNNDELSTHHEAAGASQYTTSENAGPLSSCTAAVPITFKEKPATGLLKMVAFIKAVEKCKNLKRLPENE